MLIFVVPVMTIECLFIPFPAVSPLAVDRRSVLSATSISILFYHETKLGRPAMGCFVKSAIRSSHMGIKQEPSLQLINSSVSTTTFINLE
jgi:hypothetical protein